MELETLNFRVPLYYNVGHGSDFTSGLFDSVGALRGGGVGAPYAREGLARLGIAGVFRGGVSGAVGASGGMATERGRVDWVPEVSTAV